MVDRLIIADVSGGQIRVLLHRSGKPSPETAAQAACAMFRGSASNHHLKLAPVRTLAGLPRKPENLRGGNHSRSEVSVYGTIVSIRD